MAQPEDTVDLPPKMLNQGRVPTMERVAVNLNAFQMNISQTVPEVYQYELRFVGERTIQPRGQEAQQKQQKLEVGPKNDESKETRRRLLWQLYQQLLEHNQDFFGKDKRIFSFDCALLFYSARDLGLEMGANREFLLDYDVNALEERCRNYIRRTERIRVNLLRTGTINLRNASAAYIQGDRSVVQFLEVLSSQRLYEQYRHYCFGNRLYEAESSIRLQGDPRILKKGMQKNVRFVGENQQNAAPILQIDPKKSAFFPGTPLLQFVSEFLDMSPQQIQRDWQNLMERINKQIRGLVVATQHLDTPILFQNQGVVPETAQQKSFEREGQQVTIQRHFRDTYQINLQFPNLPVVLQRTPQKESFYPMEVLTIVEGQRVPIEKQTPKLTEQMIRQCQVLPANLGEQIIEQREAAFAQNANPFFRAHNIRIEPDLARNEAQVVFPPAILYAANDRVEPEQQRGLSNWRMVGRDVNPRRNFIEPAQYPKTWAVVIVQHCVNRGECQRFCQAFSQTAQSRGLTDCGMPPRVEDYEQTDLEYVRQKFEFYAHHRCMFVLFFAPGKRQAYPGDIHQVIKAMEQRYDVLTQHVSPEIMSKGSGGGGGAAMVVENILMKTNLKMGGANYSLVTSDLFKRASRNQTDVLGDQWLGGKRMFFGMDFSHAPPQTLYERTKGKAPAVPTIVGIAWTIGKLMLKMHGTYWMQQARMATMRQQHVLPLIANIKRALLDYQSANDAFPDHIIMFRGGASEGEFKRISYWEGNSFVQALKDLAPMFHGKFIPPAVTIVICQRQSNYRVIPERINRQAKAPDQNVPPGSVVDKGMMNAALTEFLLVAHKALQGTAQPVRCTVVFEWRPDAGPASRYPPMPLEEIENITNALCYSHGIFTGATAVPGVLYAGSELAKRGRNNWKMSTQDGADIVQFDLPPQGEEGEAYQQAQQQLDDQRSQYFDEMTQRLQPNIATKFWA